MGMLTGILVAALLVGGTGLLIGIFLGFAGEKLAVEVDEREVAVREELPGNNCGGCGYPGCDGLAKAIAEGEAPVNACPVGGDAVGKKIAAIMGAEAVEGEKMVAFVRCTGDCDKTSSIYQYDGVHDCAFVGMVPSGGPKSCRSGCPGYGNCVKVCPFDAIHVVNGVAVVDKEACKACKKCIAACPKGLIGLVPYSAVSHIGCSTKEKGKAVMNVCKVGCITCKKCEKNCPEQAITVVNNNPVIDYSKCTNCGKCKEDCPRNCIV